MANGEREPYLMPNGSVVMTAAQFYRLSQAWKDCHPGERFITESPQHFYIDTKGLTDRAWKLVPQSDEAKLWLLMNYQGTDDE